MSDVNQSDIDFILDLAKQYPNPEDFIVSIRLILSPIPDKENLENYYYGIGIILHENYWFLHAIRIFEECLYNLKNSNIDIKLQIDCLSYIGASYTSLSYHQKAIEYYEKALQIVIEIEDKFLECQCYGNIGVGFYSLFDYDKAIEYHQKALEIAIELNDKNGESICYLNLGAVYDGQAKYHTAIEYHEKALEIAIEIENIERESRCYANLGRTYRALANYHKAIEYIEKALEIAIELNDKSLQSKCYINLGITYKSLEDLDKAYFHLEKSIDISEQIGSSLQEDEHKIGFNTMNANAYELIVPICRQLGRPKEEMLRYVERGKSKAFLDLMAKNRIMLQENKRSKIFSIKDIKNYIYNQNKQNYILTRREITKYFIVA